MIIKKSTNGRKTITTADKFEQNKVLPETVEIPKKKEFKPIPLSKKKKRISIPAPKKKKKGCGCGK